MPLLSAKMSILLGKHHVRLIIKNLENITKVSHSALKRHVSNLVKKITHLTTKKAWQFNIYFDKIYTYFKL